MSKVKHVACLLLFLFSPVMLIIAARAIHTVYMWVLAGIVPTQETWYLALVLTIISFTVAGIYTFCQWLDP